MTPEQRTRLDARRIRIFAEGSDRTCVVADVLSAVDMRGSELSGDGTVFHAAVADPTPLPSTAIIHVSGETRTVTIADCSILAGTDERVWLRYVKWRGRWRRLVRALLFWRR